MRLTYALCAGGLQPRHSASHVSSSVDISGVTYALEQGELIYNVYMNICCVIDKRRFRLKFQFPRPSGLLKHII